MSLHGSVTTLLPLTHGELGPVSTPKFNDKGCDNRVHYSRIPHVPSETPVTEPLYRPGPVPEVQTDETSGRLEVVRGTGSPWWNPSP